MSQNGRDRVLNRRTVLMGSVSTLAVAGIVDDAFAQAKKRPQAQPQTQPQPPAKETNTTARKPNIVFIWGDDIGQTNLSIYSRGLMGYHTPNIDRIGQEGGLFTDYYGEQSCTAGRSAFITGQSVFRNWAQQGRLAGPPISVSPRTIQPSPSC